MALGGGFDLFSLALRMQVAGMDRTLADLKSIEAAGTRTARTVSGAGVSALEQMIRSSAFVDRALIRTTTGTVRAGATAVVATISNMERKVGASALAMSRGFEGAARAGTLMGAPLSQVIAQGSMIAFMFGPAGAIVGALGIAAAAVVTFFRRSRDELEKTKQAAIKSFEDMVNAGDLAQMYARAQDIERGTLSEQLKARRTGGAAGLEARKAEVTRRQAERKAMPSWLVLLFAGAAGGQATVQLAQARSGLKKLKDELDPLEEEYDKIVAFLRDPITARARLVRPAIESKGSSPGAGPGAGLGGALNLRVPNLTLTPAAVEINMTDTMGRQFPALKVSTLQIDVEKTDLQLSKQALAMAEIQFQEALHAAVTAGLSQGIQDGFRTAVESGSLTEGFAALGRSFLSGLGGLLITIGERTLAAAAFIQKIVAFLAGLNPVGAIAASLGLIALGAVMQGAAGRGGGGGGGGYGGGGYGSGGGTTTITRTTLGATAATGAGARAGNVVVLQPTIIGPNDASAQRQIVALVENARRRGL